MHENHYKDPSLRAFTLERIRALSPSHFLLLLAALSLLHFGLARFGLFVAGLNQNASPVWPATGFAIATIVLFGRRYWPAVAIGTFAADLYTNVHLGTAVGFAVTAALEACVGAWIYCTVQKSNWFVTHSNSLGTLAASLLGPCLSATFGALSMSIGEKLATGDLPTVWYTWWIGNFIGGLSLFPMLIDLAQKRHFTWSRLFQAIPLVALGMAIAYFIFVSDSGAPCLFLVFPYILLCVNRLGSLAGFVASFSFGIISVTTTFYGIGIFQSGNLNSDLIHLQIFLSSLSITALVLPEIWRGGSNRPTAVVLLSSWILAAGIFHSLYSKGRLEVEMNFSNVITVAKQRLNSQAEHYLTALKSGVGLFKASVSVERSEWTAFATEISALNTKSGLKGLGVIFRVPANQVPEFVHRMRVEGSPNFTYHTIDGSTAASSEAYLISYVEPLSHIHSILGFDIASEQQRKTAADQAMKTGQIVWTDVIRLQRDPGQDYGFLVLHPIYKNGSQTRDEVSRLANHIGWIYCSINARDFFTAALGPKSVAELSYAVHDGKSKRLLSQSADYFFAPNHRKNLRKDVTVSFAGHEFILSVKPSAKFSTSVDLACSWAGATAALVGLLLASLVSHMQSTNEHIENLVQERSRELELTSRMAKVGGWSFDIPSRSLVLSPITREIFVNRRSEIRDVNDALKVVKDQDLRSQIEHIISTKDFTLDQWDIVVELADLSGGDMWVRVIGMKGPGGDDGGDHYYGTIQDITEQKHREFMLMQNSKMASLGEMAAGVAHEVNNPLMIISGKAYLVKQRLSKGLLDPISIRKEMDDIDSTVKRIAYIVKGLRAFSRNGDNDPLESVPLKTIIDETLVLCVERFKNQNIRLDIEPIPHITLKARSTQISQVLLNLLNNSYDSISEADERWVKISFAFLGLETIGIRVTDSGAGISPAIAEKIMLPFYTTKEVGKGTGIGLSISKGIALSHGGDLQLDRTSSNTSFVLSIPFESV
ncbi:MAG: CHASE domain-containing protein [Chitinophagaceae bacterium]|nr:CHASE domain-containing protein [Oligoflexus sp.]